MIVQSQRTQHGARFLCSGRSLGLEIFLVERFKRNTVTLRESAAAPCAVVRTKKFTDDVRRFGGGLIVDVIAIGSRIARFAHFLPR
jgi:hypothetical protein